jgi:chitinase
MYGRGYTVSNESCNGLGCPFSGPSKKGECTDSEGVMSIRQIKNLIKNKGIEPKYLKDSMMKQIAWDDQWIGYDDEETLVEKKDWADGYCFGGTMVWSIDFQEQYAMSTPVVLSRYPADTTAGPMPMTAMRVPSNPLAVTATRVPSKTLISVAAAAVLTLTTI